MDATDRIRASETLEEAVQIAVGRLEELKIVADVEIAHLEADDILCALLRKEGHEAVVYAWDDIYKWYA